MRKINGVAFILAVAQQVIGREAKQRLCYERRSLNLNLRVAVSPTSTPPLNRF